LGHVGDSEPVARVAQALARRVQAEFLEMPGLSVTFWQAMRLWNLDERVCRAVLDLLVQGGFLTETRHGAFRRVGGVG
jgi:hypothetical protein